MHFAEEGAYTGEISASMLVALGVSHVILGHSERRQYFGETDDDVNRKLVAALKHHLVPIVCIGEREEQRESGMTEEVVCRQISRAIHQIDATKLRPMVIAYEPIWAIGTGKTATPGDRRRSSSHHPRRGGAFGGQARWRMLCASFMAAA